MIETGKLPYRDRREAGACLTEALADYAGKNALVLAIPRGGVPVAAAVARALDAELDVVMARKLGAPGEPEFAIGAVTAGGGVFVRDEYLVALRVTEDYLQAEIERQKAAARRREAILRAGADPAPIENRIVIVVDDGLATGATMRAALHFVRSRAPARLIAAVPVGAEDSCRELREQADEVVCPEQPSPFFAVSSHYERFPQTSDDEVIEILREFRGAGTGS